MMRIETRKKRITPVLTLELHEFKVINAAVVGYFEAGKPSLGEFANHWGVPLSRLEKMGRNIFLG